MAVLIGHTTAIKRLFIIRNNTYIVSHAAQRAVLIWNIKKKQQVTSLSQNIDWRSIRVVSGDQTQTLTILPRRINIWNLAKDQEQEELLLGSIRIKKIIMPNDKKFIVALPRKGSVHFLSVISKSQILVFPSHTSSLKEVVFLGDKKHAISYVDDSYLNIWSLQKQKHKAVLIGHIGRIQCIAVTSDSKFLVSGSRDTTIIIWDIKKKQKIDVLKGHECDIYCLAITNDDKYIISGSPYDTIRVWSLEDRKRLAHISIKVYNVYNVKMYCNLSRLLFYTAYGTCKSY